MAREQGCLKRALAEAMDGEGQSAVCGEPSDPMKGARESAKRTACRGKRPLVTLGLSKVTRPGPKGGRNPVEGKALAFYGAKPYPAPTECQERGDAVTEQHHYPPSTAPTAPPPPGDAFPPATDL